MARTKMEPIKALGKLEKLTVQKSKPLYALWRSELTLAEFKILDTYLARINSRDPEKRVVVFEKGELEHLLGVDRLKVQDLDQRLAHLMTTISIKDETTKRGFTRIALFEKAQAEQDEYGQWTVNLECTKSAMKYIFDIEHLGYLRYKLRCITSITSRYTYIMFLYLEQNRFRRTWTIGLQELKEMLNCTAERYKEFKYFRREVLERVKKEMDEKTECRFNFEPIKKGRSVVSIRFTLKTLPKLEDTEEMPELELEEDTEEGYVSTLWAEPLQEFEFSKEQLDELFSVLCTIPDYKLPESEYGGLEARRYHYIAQKVATMKRQNAKNTVRNKQAYLLAMLRKDAKYED